MIASRFIFANLLCISLLWLSACATTSPPSADAESTPPSPETSTADKVANAIAPFQQREELASYFAQAKGYIVLPRNFRAGTGFGGAVGNGWLVVDGQVQSKVYHWQFLAGADLGFQFYKQILFLKDQATLDEFQGNVFQFAGQANATALLWGKGLTPSYHSGVALFTLIDGGLLLEASVGLHSFHIRKEKL